VLRIGEWNPDALAKVMLNVGSLMEWNRNQVSYTLESALYGGGNR
jgi:hypothetical protein